MMKPAKIESSDSLQSLDKFEVPEGWEYKKLGEIVSPSKEKIEPTADSDLPYVGLEHIESNTSKIIRHDIASKAKSTKTIFHSGDVLYGKLRPYLNKVTIPNFDGVCSTDILVFNQNQIIDNHYLMRFLSTKEVVEYATLKSKGISLPRVSFESLAEFPVPLPPLHEQQRIVARVEALLANVNAARERLQRVPLTMKRFRETVLQHTIQGRLTDQRLTDESAENLLIKIQNQKEKKKNQSIFSSKTNQEYNNPFLQNLPINWTWARLNDICFLITDGTHVTPKYTSSGIPFLSVNNLKSCKISFNDCKFISEADHQKLIKRCKPEKNDLIMGKVGSIGGCDVITTDEEFSIFVQLALIKPCYPLVDSNYVKYALLSKFCQEQIKTGTAGSSMQYIGVGKIQELLFPLPPLAEQHEIVRRVEALFARADAVEREVAAATKRADALTQAILAKAFAGKL